MTKYDVILPAGGTIEAAFAEKVGTDSKALVEIGGTTVLERTMAALKGSGVVNRTVVIGGEKVRNSVGGKLADFTLPEGSTGPENIFRGLDALAKADNPPDKVLIVTCDLPFLTPELIKGFVESCPEDRDICVPLVNQKSFHARFPGTDASFVALKDDVWTTGCIFVIDVAALRKARPHIERVFENRKSKFGMAKLLGPAFVYKWLRKQLTLADVEAKIQSLLGCSGRAIVHSAPEFTFDIDYIEDYEYAVESVKSGREAAGSGNLS